MIQKTIYLRLTICLFFIPFSFFSQENTANFFEILKQKKQEFKNGDFEDIAFQKKHKKFKRWQWFWQQRIDKKGNLNAYSKELFASENLNELRSYAISDQKNAHWKIIGPEKYPDGTNPSGIIGIGRIDAIVVHPKNENHIIIGARSGGIWETKNGNDSTPYWKCLTNNLPVTTVNDLKIINNTLYAATSNVNATIAQGDSKYGLGIIKKKLTDSLWQLPNQTFESMDIAVSKSNAKLMYAVGEKYIYKSENAGNDWKKLSNPVKNITTSKILLTNIEVNPFNDNQIIVTGRLHVYNLTNNKKNDILIFKSDDGGKSWTNLTIPLEEFINKKFKETNARDKPIALAKGLKNHISTYIYQNKLFLCVQQMYHPNHVYFVTLEEDWNTFKLFNSLSKNNTYHYTTDNVDVRFQVVNDNTILIGNRKLRLINNKKHTIKSFDKNYKYLHQDIRAINFNKETGSLFVGTDGGINKAMNTNNFMFNSFDNLSGNLNLFLAFNMSYINKNEKRTVRIGTQDTGYYTSENTGNEWTNWTRFGSFGEGMVYTDPVNPDIVYRINAGGHGGNIQKSTDNGKRFSNTKIKAGNYVASPLEINPNNNQQLIFDNFKKYDQYTLSLSNNQMKTAIPIANGIEQLDKGINLAVAISKKNARIFYVARKDAHLEKYGINNSLYKSENLDFNNPSKIKYTNLTANIIKADSTIINNAFITDIEINDTNENELWLSFGNLEEGKKVFHSSDGGIHWKNISINLPNVPVNVIKYNATTKELYIGNDYGVYKYNNNAKQWNRYGYGLPIAMVTAIEIDTLKEELIVATHGRSVWTAPMLKNEDYIVSRDTIWTTNHEIKGDLIIKEGVSLLVNNAIVKANNITIENNAKLNLYNTQLTSNYYYTTNYFNTNIVVAENGNINVSNSKINNYTINLSTNSTFTLYGNNSTSLQHTIVNVFKNANYHQHKNTPLILKDKDASLLFFDGANFGTNYNCKNSSEINFSGNGSVKMVLPKNK